MWGASSKWQFSILSQGLRIFERLPFKQTKNAEDKPWRSAIQ